MLLFSSTKMTRSDQTEDNSHSHNQQQITALKATDEIQAYEDLLTSFLRELKYLTGNE